LPNSYTPHQKRHFAEQLKLLRPAREVGGLAFRHSALPAERQRAFLQGANGGLTGAASIDKPAYSHGRGGEREEHILLSVVTDSGAEIGDDMFERMLETPAEVVGPAPPDGRLDQLKARLQPDMCAAIDEANKKCLVELKAWRSDCDDTLTRETGTLRKPIRLERGRLAANIGAPSFRHALDVQAEINGLSEGIAQRQRQMLQRRDAIAKTASDLQKEVIDRMDGTARTENIMAFSFEPIAKRQFCNSNGVGRLRPERSRPRFWGITYAKM
jgi:hypothetical protein